LLELINDSEVKMSEKKKKRSPYTYLAFISQVAFVVLVPVIGCFFLGRLLDVWLNTGPVFLFIFIVIGAAAGFRNLYMMPLRWAKVKNEKEVHDSENFSGQELEEDNKDEQSNDNEQ
jgi:F0F1-type ATP synthase assembly protein I